MPLLFQWDTCPCHDHSLCTLDRLARNTRPLFVFSPQQQPLPGAAETSLSRVAKFQDRQQGGVFSFTNNQWTGLREHTSSGNHGFSNLFYRGHGSYW